MEGLEAKALKEGKPGDIPPALLNRPTLSQFEQPFYDAFHILSGSRTWTMGGAAPIPLSEINAYFDMFGINDPEEREEYLIIIRDLDSVYLKFTAEKIKS